jgi:hypothetical protein
MSRVTSPCIRWLRLFGYLLWAGALLLVQACGGSRGQLSKESAPTKPETKLAASRPDAQGASATATAQAKYDRTRRLDAQVRQPVQDDWDIPLE